jgi:periplasmic protein TonB
MNRNTLLSVLLLVVLAPGAVLADAARAPGAKAASAKTTKGEVSDSPQRTVEAQGPVQLVTPQPRFQPKTLRDLFRASDSLGPAGFTDHTTIAPFPVPGDTSREAAEQMKLLNVPRAGQLTIAPVPPPAGVQGGVYFGPAGPAFGGSVMAAPPDGAIPPPMMFSNPGPIYTVPPQYPDAARKAGAQGTVWVMIHVLEDGSVGEATVTRSIPLLDEAAVKAVKQWRFAPPTSGGKPTTAWLRVPVRFTLH